MTEQRSRSRNRRSITSHRLFPPLVALWFGALFGLSTLAVRTELFEMMVVSSGFDRLVPAASPPLGHTARLLIALGFALVGAGIGHVVARLVAGRGRPSTWGDSFYPPSEPQEQDDYRVRPRDAHPDAPARRPISAHDELGGESFVGGGIAADRWQDEARPARIYEPQAWEPAAAEELPMPAWFKPAEAPASVSEWTPPAAEAPAVPAAWKAPEPEAAPGPLPAPEAATPAEAPEAAPAAPLPPAWRNTAERIHEAPPAQLSHVELIERLAIALQKRQAAGADGGEGGAAAGAVDPDPEATATIQALRDALTSLRGG